MKTRTHIMTINQYYCRKTSNFGRILEKLIPNSRSYTAITSSRASKFDFFSCSLHCGYFFRSWMCFRVSHICSKILINSLTGTKLGWFRCLPPFIRRSDRGPVLGRSVHAGCIIRPYTCTSLWYDERAQSSKTRLSQPILRALEPSCQSSSANELYYKTVVKSLTNNNFSSFPTL